MIDLSAITVAQFKQQFRRDFPYLPIYDNTQIYNAGDVVYYPPSGLFYQSIMDGIRGQGPLLRYDEGNKYDAAGNKYDSNQKYWIKYASTLDNYICDEDITAAFAEAMVLFNTALFANDMTTTLGFLYLAAHFLCNDINAARGGVNGTGRFMLSARTVGSVSESYQIPTAFTDSPILAGYASSSYGMKYLAMILPKLTGNVVAVFGGSQP